MTTTEPLSAESAVETPTGLRTGALGVGSIVFIVISAAAPLTIIAGIAPIAILIGGIGAPIVYIFAGIVLAIFAIAFMGMTRYVKTLGGFYAYITAALGKAVGLGASFLAFLSYNALQIGLYGLLGVSAHQLFIGFGLDVPWWLFAIVAIAAVYFVAARGVDVGAKILAVLLVAESAILFAFAIAVLSQGGAEGITFGSFSPEAVFNPGLFAIVGMGFAAFMGFESTALYRGEAKDPNRTIPRATYIAVGFMAIFYGFIMWAVVIAAGETAAQGMAADNTAGMVYDLISRYLGSWAATSAYVLILTSVYASQLAFHNAINRYTYSLARDRAFPRVLQRTGRKTGSPWVAGLVQTALALVVVISFAAAGSDPYLQLLLWVNSPGIFGIIALQIITCVAVIVYFLRRPNLVRPRFVLTAAVVAGLLMTVVLALLVYYIDVLTAAGPVINGILLALVPLPFIVGFVLALVWKRTKPARYAHIGEGDREVTDA